ncbi:MAG: serine hydrolase domain-containing protein [Candidatus Xenobia bacterium]
MRRCIPLLVLLLVLPVLASPSLLPLAIREYMDDAVHPGEPGAAIAVLQDGHPLYMKCFGLADLTHKVPIRPDTAFDLASCSKQFTAMAVMLLAERGKLHLDDDVRRWLPELGEVEETRPIHIEDLLHHISGLPDYVDHLNEMHVKRKSMGAGNVLALVDRLGLDWPTGTRWEYSNTNYRLLAVIVERASHQRFADFLHDNIFGPLGMKHSAAFTQLNPDEPWCAHGYDFNDQGTGFDRESRDFVPAGDSGIWSSIEDLARWDAALSQHRLVSPAMYARAWKMGRLDDGRRYDYGFGWRIVETDFGHEIEHDGEWLGFRTWIGRFLDRHRTIVILSNEESFDVDAASSTIIRALFGPPPTAD